MTINTTESCKFLSSENDSKIAGNVLITIVICLCFAFDTVAEQPFQVDVMYPERIEQSQIIKLPGTIQAKQHAQLASLESGRVESLAVEVGDVVNKGQVLLILESQLAELEVTGALAEVKAAELNLQEAKRLYGEVQKLSVQQAVAKTLIAERAALLANAEVELARVKANHNIQQERLNRHRLKAPFTGVIAERNVDVGEWITPQNSVLTLVAQNDLRLAIEVPQQHYNTLRAINDVKVRVIPDTAGIESISATLSRLVPVSDFQTRTFSAQIDLPVVASNGWVPGMSAQAELSFPDSEQSAIILPRSAIKQHPDGNSSVFVVDNNQARRLVTAFTSLPNNQVAIYGQPANQAYIVSGVELLREGSTIVANVIQNEPQ